jgi:hypothetical protein
MYMQKSFLLFACLFAFFWHPINGETGLSHQLIIHNPNYNPGMFSVFNSILGALDQYDRSSGSSNGIEVYLASGMYFDPAVGPNWWEYFFEPLSIRRSENFIPYLFDDNQLSSFAWGALNIPRQRGNELIKKYIKLKKTIKKKLRTFVKEEFARHFIIGIHYRGTDKKTEARRVDYEEVAAAIYKVEKKLSTRKRNKIKLFIATDEEEFIQFIRMRFSWPICYINAQRATGDYPIHCFNYIGNNYQKGEDAIMDCLLLSKANFLIRTVSNLSFISERFNHRVPVICLE